MTHPANNRPDPDDPLEALEREIMRALQDGDESETQPREPEAVVPMQRLLSAMRDVDNDVSEFSCEDADDGDDMVEQHERAFMERLRAEDTGPTFAVQPIQTSEVPLVRVSGELDVFTSAQLEISLQQAAKKSDRLLVDLAHASYVDSTGFSLLLRAHRWFPGGFGVITGTGRIARLFQLTGLSQRMRLYPTTHEAMAALDPED